MPKPVLTIFYQFNPWQISIGGIQTVIRSFIKYAPNDFELRLVGIGDEQRLPTGKWQEAEWEGKAVQFMPLFTLPNENSKHLIPTSVKYTAALLRHCLASDFMHFHRLEPTIATLNWPGEKTLFVHNDIQKQMDSKGNKDSIAWRYFPAGYFALERLLLGQFAQILSCNTQSLQHYRDRYPSIADRVSYVKNTVDNNVYYPLTWEAREQGRRVLATQMGLAADTRFVLFAGRLHPQKDPVLLLRAIAALNLDNVHLLIAGDGDLRTEVSTEINRLGLSRQVTMLGPVNQAKLAQLQQVSSLFVLTSAYEGLPLVALEALACGTPVVTTNCGETPKLLTTNSGVVCGERTPTAIADAMRRILLRPDDFPIAACVKAAAPYSASTVVGSIYNDMLHRWQQRHLLSTDQITHKTVLGV